MKKLVAMLGAIVLLFSLTACSKDEASVPESGNSVNMPVTQNSQNAEAVELI